MSATKSDTLYEIEGDIASLLVRLSECPDDSIELMTALQIELDRLRVSEGQKLSGIARLISQWERNAEACQAEAKRLRDRAVAYENKINRLKGYVMNALPYGHRWDDGIHSLRWQRTEVVEPDPLAPELPEQYLRVRVITEPNKALIKQVLKEGGSVEGWHIKTNKHVRFE